MCVTALMPFAALYAWHECVQLVFVVVNWKETVPTLNQQGIEAMRECDSTEVDLLQSVYDQTRKLHLFDEPDEAKKDKQEICW